MRGDGRSAPLPSRRTCLHSPRILCSHLPCLISDLYSLDVWVCSSGLLGAPSIEATTPADLQKCFEANSMSPFFALKYGPPAMAKTTSKGNYPNAAPKDQKYGSIIVVSSVASTYGGESIIHEPTG